jgi:hypothetical protein
MNVDERLSFEDPDFEIRTKVTLANEDVESSRRPELFGDRA